MKTLLLGMGNPILTDDAVGVRLASDFKQRLADIPNIDFVEECCVGGLNLIDVFYGYQRAIVLDSILAADRVPGRWHRFDGAALDETMHLTNIHDVNFATALELGRRLKMPLPEPSEIHIFAVEVEDNLSFSERMTSRLEETYPRYASEILGEVRRLLIQHQAESFDERSGDRC